MSSARLSEGVFKAVLSRMGLANARAEREGRPLPLREHIEDVPKLLFEAVS